MMRLKNIILLSVVVCIGTIVFFFACKYTYDSKMSELKQKSREAFDKALGQELKGRNMEGGTTFQFKSEVLKADMPDSVYLQDENGRHKYRLDPVKSQMNITNDNNMRSLHSIAFIETPINLDSLNTKWRNHLAQSGIFAESIICITVTDKASVVNLLNKTKPEWCNVAHLMFTVYIGYACEIEVLGYTHNSFWSLMGFRSLFYLLICIISIFVVYKLSLLVQKKIMQMLGKRIIEVPIMKVVKEVSDTPIRSYVLHENIIFYAERQMIEVNGVENDISPQASQLLELFLQNKENDYILSDKIIIENLWTDKYAGVVRLHKAIDRLRSALHKIDSSIDIIRSSGTFQMII